MRDVTSTIEPCRGFTFPAAVIAPATQSLQDFCFSTSTLAPYHHIFQIYLYSMRGFVTSDAHFDQAATYNFLHKKSFQNRKTFKSFPKVLKMVLTKLFYLPNTNTYYLIHIWLNVKYCRFFKEVLGSKNDSPAFLCAVFRDIWLSVKYSIFVGPKIRF